MCLRYRHLLWLRMPPKECPHKQSTEQSLSCLVSVLKNLSQALTKDLILSPSHTEDECTLQVVPWFSSAAAQSLTPATASKRCAGSNSQLAGPALCRPGFSVPAVTRGWSLSLRRVPLPPAGIHNACMANLTARSSSQVRWKILEHGFAIRTEGLWFTAPFVSRHWMQHYVQEEIKCIFTEKVTIISKQKLESHCNISVEYKFWHGY